MAYSYVIDPIAAVEYEEAFMWYEERSAAAADGFIIAVQNAISAACDNPKRYRNTHKNLRELSLKKYPFNLIYYIDDKKHIIVIISIYHHKRSPKGKYLKTKSKH
ncbi:MAG: type II toxin-antitoxin system RelE/ParE family toxin [Niabella sp.]